jgi:hypothetical protein
MWRMLGVKRALVDTLLDCRHDIQGSLVWLQSFVIQPWRFFVCVSGHMTTDRNDCLCVWTHDYRLKRHHNRTWNPVELDIIQFVLRSWRSEWCTEYWHCFDVLLCVWVGPYGWRLDWTFSGWVFPPLTCVNRFQDECEVCEGCSVYGGFLWTPSLTSDLINRARLLNSISYNLFWEVGVVSGVQSHDFDVLLCVWVWTVRLTSRLDVQCVSFPSLDMCESIPGRVRCVWRMLGV